MVCWACKQDIYTETCSICDNQGHSYVWSDVCIDSSYGFFLIDYETGKLYTIEEAIGELPEIKCRICMRAIKLGNWVLS